MDSSCLYNELKDAKPFFLIAGPNVIESDEHIMRMAKHLKSISSKVGLPLVFKSSFDKANRTSSNSFRGPGMIEGLKILEKVKLAYDLPVITDVHESIQAKIKTKRRERKSPIFLGKNLLPSPHLSLPNPRRHRPAFVATCPTLDVVSRPSPPSPNNLRRRSGLAQPSPPLPSPQHNRQNHCNEVGKIADIIQIPAFLCRQTDLLVSAAKTGKIINIKKGQFCAPSVMMHSAEKVRLAGNRNVMVCERGTMFGYNDLIVDPRNLEWMRKANCPVVADITHSLQQPAGRKLEDGGVASGGLRESIPCIARTAVAVGVDGIFMEVHDDPLRAPVDGPTQWPLRHLEELLQELVCISKASKGKEVFDIDLTPFQF